MAKNKKHNTGREKNLYAMASVQENKLAMITIHMK